MRETVLIMPVALRFATKYIRTKKRGLVKMTSMMAVCSVAVGVAGLVLAQTVGRGFEDEMRARILESSSHIMVRRTDETVLREESELRAKVASIEGVSAVRAVGFIGAILASKDGKDVRNVIVRVDEAENPGEGRASLGERLSEKLAHQNSTRLTVQLPSTERRIEVEVASTFTTGIYEYDSTQIRLSKQDFARLVGDPQFIPSMLSVSVNDIYQSAESARRIRDLIGTDYSVVDWQEANRPLFAALALERRVALVVIALILIVAAFNITTTLSLLVSERRLDVAVMRTCGASGGTVVGTFLLEGIFIALMGIGAGLGLGAVACEAINRSGVLRLSPEVYSVTTIQLKPEASEMVLIGFVGLAIALLASVIPALRSISVKPVENLRRL